MNRKTICIILLVVGLALAVISWFVLPDQVATKFSMEGEVLNTAPKALALALPLIFTVLGPFIYYRAGENATRKHLSVSSIGILIFLLTLLVNYLAQR